MNHVVDIMKKNALKMLVSLFLVGMTLSAQAQSAAFNGLDMSLGNLSRLSKAETRSISPENFTGEKGKGGMADPVKDKDIRNAANAANVARDLGQGWKVNPFINIKAGETITIAEIEGSGAIQQIWMTPTGNWRYTIIRIYWDGEEEPSVECPVGDFFASAYNKYAQLSSLAVCVNPGSAFNCYWKMPFRKKARITMENMDTNEMRLYYQVNYTLTDVPEDEAYFHAQYRRSNFTEGAIHTLLDGVKGNGHYVGTYMACRVTNTGWWGEGEIKFYMDGDKKFPTICGTGAEDYFCGSYNFDTGGKYQEYTTPYAGLHQVIRPDGLYNAMTCFGMYRWHIQDPIRFKKDLRVTIQDLGWRDGGRYLQQRSDIATVSYWYQAEPHMTFPIFPSKDELEIK